MEFAFRYDRPSALLLTALGLGRRFSGLTVDEQTVIVRMGWGFRATVPRNSITAARVREGRPISRGVHGWRGRWLVNGAGKGLVTLTVDPPVRAWATGIPIRLRELTVSVDAPAELIEALAVG